MSGQPIVRRIAARDLLARTVCEAAPVQLTAGGCFVMARMAGWDGRGAEILLDPDTNARHVLHVGQSVDLVVWQAGYVDIIEHLVVSRLSARVVTVEADPHRVCARRLTPHVSPPLEGPARFLPIGPGPRARLRVVNLSEQGLAVAWTGGGVLPGVGRPLRGWVQLPHEPPVYVSAIVRHVREEGGVWLVGLHLLHPSGALRRYVEAQLAVEVVAEVA